MKGTEELLFALRAGYALFYVQTWEMERIVQNIDNAILEFQLDDGDKPFNTYVWDLETAQEKGESPEAFINWIDDSDLRTISIAKNFHWFLKDDSMGGAIDKALVQMIQNRVSAWTSTEARKGLVIVGDASFESAIPEVLQKEFLPIDFPLPDETEIDECLDFVLGSARGDKKFSEPNEEEKNLIRLNSRGMTKREITNAYSFALIKGEGKLEPKTVAEIQAKEVSKTAGLRIGDYEGMDEPLGMDNVKDFALRSFMDEDSLGLMLLGPPGTGKTMFARWLASISGRKCIEMEMAELFGGLVGESEEKMRKAIAIIKANVPCILFVDEIEKGLSGVNSQGMGDGGTTTRSMGQFLKFLSDRPKGLYVIATCNDISSLPPEYVRSERWDTAPFFIDVPNDEERKIMFDFYRKKFNVEGEVKATSGWSGAEIKTICRLTSIMNRQAEKNGKKKKYVIPDLEKFIVPISETMKDKIDGLRKWALTKEGKKLRCVPATTAINGKSGKRDLKI